MKIGLFGGTFDPPHLGHLQIAQQVLDFTDCEEVWFVVNFQQNPPKPASNYQHRLEMTKLMVKNYNNPSIKTSTLEIDNHLNGKTIELLPFLPKENSYRFIIGSDLLPSFHLWQKWEQLLEEIPFCIFPRLGYANEPLYQNMTMVNDPSLVVTNLSATKVRDFIKRKILITPFVDKDVVGYIQDNSLYLG